MRQYLEVLQNVLENGVEKESGRANMPNAIGISGAEMRMNLEDGFPLLTTKKMFWEGVVHELLWIIRGETNIKYLVDNKVNIWNGDAYRWYLTTCKGGGTVAPKTNNELIRTIPIQYPTIESFIDAIKNCNTPPEITSGYKLGDLGKVYGHQWRNQNGVDQLKDLVRTLQTNPYSRYHILDAWNKADFNEMALPPCHLLYQFIVRPLNKKEKVDWLNANYLMYDQRPWTIDMLEKSGTDAEIINDYNMPKFYLDLSMYQRSCDLFLGVPFNIASMSIFLIIMAKAVGMIPGVARWVGGDVHLYTAHIDAAEEQLKRTPYPLPKLVISKNLKTFEDILSLTINDFQILSYHYHPAIKQELFTGYKR